MTSGVVHSDTASRLSFCFRLRFQKNMLSSIGAAAFNIRL